MKCKCLKKESFDLLWVLLAFAMTSMLAYHTFRMQDTWPGVPPATSRPAALFYGFGDVELSYRNIGLMLQNAGDTGGRTTSFKKYDYKVIEKWLWLEETLDPRANYVPSLAAYYFGASNDPKQLKYLVSYLAHVGSDTKNERWRWLAHAVYLARFKLNDQKWALKLANKLADMRTPDMPAWTKVMPAYVMKAMGEKKEARDLMLLIMADPKNLTDQADVNQSCWFINENLREPNDGLDQNPLFSQLCSAYIKEYTEEDKQDNEKKLKDQALQKANPAESKK